MGQFVLHQLPPLAAAWILFRYLGRGEGFRRHGVPILFAAGAILQLVFWWGGDPSIENPDSASFYRLSRGLEEDLRALLYRPKLYPLFLALMPSLKAATLAQCLLKLGAGVFVLRLARRAGCGAGGSSFALALYLFNSFWLSEPLQILDTTLFTFLFTGFLWLAAETSAEYTHGRYLGLCAFAGLTALTRQVGDASLLAVLALVTAPLLPGMRAPGMRPGLPGPGPSRPRAGVLAAGILLAGALAWSGAVANGAWNGVFRRSVALGVNLYTHSSYYELADPRSREWEFVLDRLPDARAGIGDWDTHWSKDVPWPVNALPHRLERALGTGTAAEILETDGMLAARYRRWVVENPGRFAASAFNEAARLLWKCEEYHPQSLIGKVAALPDAAIRMERGLLHQPPVLLLLLAAFGFLAHPRARGGMVLPALGVAGYLFLIPFIHIGFTRYVLPALPALLALAAAGTEGFWERLSGTFNRGGRPAEATRPR